TYSLLKEKAMEVDASLVASLEAEEKRQLTVLSQWGSRFTRALKKKNETSINQLRKVHSKLFPLGYLQERHENFLNFQSRNENNFMTAVYENTSPFSAKFCVLRLG
ncbi:bacillithiol biosynthesis BshC, partial [Bacteroidota bacterium]